MDARRKTSIKVKTPTACAEGSKDDNGTLSDWCIYICRFWIDIRSNDVNKVIMPCNKDNSTLNLGHQYSVEN